MGVNFNTRSRCEILAEYMIDTNSTVRNCATVFGISKSTVHKDITDRLKHENMRLYTQVKILLEKNKSERHLRGGEATRLKFLKERGPYVNRHKIN